MFKSRFLHQFRTIFSYWRSMIDGIMLFYLTVPTTIFGYYFVRETILKAQYGLLNDLPLMFSLIGMLVISSLLQHRYYIEFADRLFLIQQPVKFVRLKLAAFLLSFLKNSVILSVLFLLMFIYFSQVKGLEDWQLIQLALILFVHLLLSEINKYIANRLIRFAFIIVSGALLVSSIYTGPAICYLTAVLFLIVMVYFIKFYIYPNVHFEKQAQLEFEASSKIQRMMLKLNPQYAALKQDVFTRKKPMLFKKLFAKTVEGAIVELSLKTIWRRKKYWIRLLQLTAVLIVAIILLLCVNLLNQLFMR